MVEIEKNVLTQKGLRRYEEKSQGLHVNKCKEIADKIKKTKGQDSLSKSTEYGAKKGEQRDIEARVGEPKELLKYMEVYVTEEMPTDKVSIDNLMKVLGINKGEELTFRIVDNEGADLTEGHISNESPLGAALLDEGVGEQVMAKLPAGDLSYRVFGVTRGGGDE